MRAGTGIHVLPGGNPILYCCNHFVKNLMRRDAQIGYLRFDEYSVQAGFGNDDIITDIADGWIDLFDHDDFSGARITILGEKLEDSKFENYKKIYARDESFGDRISSLRFQLPDGVEYLLYEHHSFGGKRIPLEGTGKVEESRHIRFGVSSSQFL
ncbi:MAG: hypothetical protein IIB00_10765 [candidate division Zixibacteria bacterium]|nr:hypothetical protein [candidate division Zixibacteria bacterium]